MANTHLKKLVAQLPLAGLRVVDVGCGDGGFSRLMAGQGATVTGIEVTDARLAEAGAVPPVAGETYRHGGGEALPLPDGAADLVVFLFSLHHVPVDRQVDALGEAARVLVPGGRLAVIEPLAEGAYFEVSRWIDDETIVRAAAQEALTRAGTHGLVMLHDETYTHTLRLTGFDEFHARMVAIDPA